MNVYLNNFIVRKWLYMDCDCNNNFLSQTVCYTSAMFVQYLVLKKVKTKYLQQKILNFLLSLNKGKHYNLHIKMS